MLPFLHHRLGRITDLLELSNAALHAHHHGNLDTADRIDSLLVTIATTYGELGLDVGANEVLTLRAQHTAARRGYPLGATSKATCDRRGLERAVGLTVLSTATERLRADTDHSRATLDDGREQLRVLILHGLRIGLIPAHATPAFDAHTTWKAFLADPDARPLAQQVAMRLNTADIHLLLTELISLVAAS